ncbi:hypothetical protein As57867_003771, partial [Aphanomyces stellatus]
MPANTSNAAVPCPYSKLTSSASISTVDERLCGKARVSCVVNNACVVQNTSKYDYVGDYSGLGPANTSVFFNVYLDNLWFASATLPDSIETITLEGFQKMYIPDDFKWPKSLANLTYNSDQALFHTSAIPPTVQQVSYGAAAITRTQPFPPSVQYLYLTSLMPSSIMQIAGVNAPGIRGLHIENCRLISNLKLGPALKYMRFGPYSFINSWVMDADTFAALNNLTPRGNFTNSKLPATEGVEYNGIPARGGPLSINTSLATCDEAKGTLRELWPYRMPVVEARLNATEEKSRFMVCVTGSSEPGTGPGGATGGGMSTGLVVGIAAAVAVVLGVGVFYFLRRRRRADAKQPTYTTTFDDVYTASVEKLNMDDLALYRLDMADLILTKVVGAGAFADVWLGSYENCPVAVKKLHRNRVSTQQMESFVDEIKLMSKFDSPYIVKLVGAVWTRPADLQCVMEYMDGGDLRDYLTHHSPAAFHWSDKYLHIHSIVEGLVYLHSMDIIHRDLKSRNILLDSTKGTKLTDFGISKEDMQATMTMGVGTFRWMA